MKALEVFTINSSSEFAIRQFILKYEEETINQMMISFEQTLNKIISKQNSPITDVINDDFLVASIMPSEFTWFAVRYRSCSTCYVFLS